MDRLKRKLRRAGERIENMLDVGRGRLIERTDMNFTRARMFHDRPISDSDRKALYAGLDAESISTIEKLVAMYDYVYTHNFFDAKKFKQPPFLTMREKQEIMDRLNLPSDMRSFFLEDLYYHHSGLRFVPENVRKGIRGKTIIDCGAYIGDSALVFEREYQPGRILAVEPMANNIEGMKRTIRNAGLRSVVPVNKGVGSKKNRILMSAAGPESHRSELGGNEVEITTIDDIVEEQRVDDLAVIKMDIEGCELDAVKGALKSIRRFRPVLLISVYHTPEDLFYIKPLIEKSVDGYAFMFRHLITYHGLDETELIAYPKK